MNSDTITLDRIETLRLSLMAAATNVGLIKHLATIGDMTPEECATKINELMAELQAIAE